MFDFRIIPCEDGTEIIDQTLKTPYESLTPCEMVEYTEVDSAMYCIDIMRKKEQKAAEHQRKLVRNPLYRLACRLGYSR